MKSFKILVEKCAKNLETHTITNSSEEHALLLFEKMLEVAVREKQDIKIFSGCLEENFYTKLIEKAKQVLDQGNAISIVIANSKQKDINTHAFIKALKPYKGKGFEVKTLTGNNKNAKFPHYLLVGNATYRVEIDDGLRKAIANFNDPQTGKLIAEQHEKLLH